MASGRTACVALAVLGSFLHSIVLQAPGIAQVETPVTDETFYPAYFVSDKALTCVMRFDVTDPDREARKKQVLDLLFLSNITSRNPPFPEHRLAGIDLVEFRRFYAVVVEKTCKESSLITEYLTTSRGVLRRQDLDGEGSALVATIRDLQGEDQLRYYARVRPLAVSKECLVRLRMERPADEDWIRSTARMASGLMVTDRYQLPFLAVISEGRDYYFLISYGCSSRVQLMELLRELVIQHGGMSEASNWQFHYGEDVKAFLEHRGVEAR